MFFRKKKTIKIPLFLVYPFIPFVPYLSKFVIKNNDITILTHVYSQKEEREEEYFKALENDETITKLAMLTDNLSYKDIQRILEEDKVKEQKKILCFIRWTKMEI